MFDSGRGLLYLADKGLTPTDSRRLETGGMVVGLFEHTNFDEQTLQLETGDLLVAYSDGVTEARNFEGHEFGESPPEPSPSGSGADARQRMQVSPLFLRPTGLADGLALKESRYGPVGRFAPTARQSAACPNGSPVPGRCLAVSDRDSAGFRSAAL